MGEKSYSVGHKYIQFSESDDEFVCLCTFPHNDLTNIGLELERVRSLAIFGAVVKLVLAGYYADHENEYIYIPDDVPQYVLDAVRNLTLH